MERATNLSPSKAKTKQKRCHWLIEKAVKHGQSSPAPVASQFHRLIMGGGKWQSTLVTLTVEDTAGAACHYFNSDLWRYGGRASLLRKPDWHEVDAIDLKISYEHIEVSLQEAETKRSTTWSWSSDEKGRFRMHPDQVHVVEMVCGYLNLAAGRKLKHPVKWLFDVPEGSLRASPVGLLQYLHWSFVEISGVTEQLDQHGRYTTEMIGHADVEALTRVHGEPMKMATETDRPRKPKCLTTADSDMGLSEGTVVRLPGVWSACGGNPCVCGDSVMVLDTTRDELQVRELRPGEQYLAMSYVWTQHDERSLISFIRRAIEVTGVRSVWVDQLCINQRCDKHKARQIPRMREVYETGYATVALVPDVTKPISTVLHTSTAPISQKALMDAWGFATEIKHSAWRNRCWTWQEGLLGRRGYYVTQKQVLPARLVSDFLVRFLRDKRPVGIETGLMDSLGVRSLRCRIQTWRQFISIGHLLDVEDREQIQYWLMPQAKSLGEALQLTENREASFPEDEIYSVLGMVPKGADLQVVYGESRSAILRRAANLGLVGAEILVSDSVNNGDGESWAAEDDTSKPIARIYRMLGCPLRSAQIDDRGLTSQFYKLKGVMEVDVHGGGCVRIKMANNVDVEISYTWHVSGDLVSRLDQVLLLEKPKHTLYFPALLVSGTGRNVVRLATGNIRISLQWYKIETEVVWRVVG